MTDTDANSPAPPARDVTTLTPGEVAVLFRCDPKTVTRWADTGKLTSFKTPGGHRRFIADEVFQAIARTTTVAGEQS